MRRANLIGLWALFLALAFPLTIPTPASATLTDPCTASADVTGDDGTSFGSITPKTKTGVYTVPLKGEASYNGALAGVEEPDEGRHHDGYVAVELPLGMSVNVKTWGEDDSTKVSDAGTVDWDLPEFTPRGVEVTVSGEHNDDLIGSCSGAITVKFDGNLFDSATGLVTAGLTVATGLLTLATGIPKP